MDVADTLVDKIFSWVELMEECSNKLKQKADEIEETNKNANVAKVIGSSVSVAGATAMTAAGVATVLTGGLALPFLAGAAVAGGAASWFGLANNAVADVVSAAASGSTLNEAGEVVKEIKDLHEEIEELVEKLKEEAQNKGEHDGSCDDQETELILRAMAKRVGLIVDDCVSLKKILEENFGQAVETAIWPAVTEAIQITAILVGLSVGGNLAEELIETAAKKAVRSVGQRTAAKAAAIAAKEAVRTAGGRAAAKAAAKAAAMSAGAKLAAKAAGRMVGGGLGLLISVPELVDNCKSLGNAETEASKSLRENAKNIRAESEEMKNHLQQILKLFERLARVKHCIQNRPKSNNDKKVILEFAVEYFNNEVVQQWLQENSDDEILYVLLDLFESVRKEITKKEEEEKKKKRKKKEIDITFVAHGAISSARMIPACCLLPLSSIKDVVLYSPWNCYITADVAYGIATGRIKPLDRLFECANRKRCAYRDEQHWPRVLPLRWNSMKEVGHQNIPNITVSPMKTPHDGAFNRFKLLEDKFGSPNTNRVVIVYMPPGPPDVPFYVVTLALALVLFVSGYKATVHLAACLGEKSAVDMREYLQQQYAYTINNTGMTVTHDRFSLRDEELYRTLKVLFGETNSMY